jgi:hypothetical protein
MFWDSFVDQRLGQPFADVALAPDLIAAGGCTAGVTTVERTS